MSIKNTALTALIFVALYNILFFHTNLGVGTGFLFLALNLYFFLTRNRQSKNLNLAYYSSSVAVIFAFLFAFRDNGIVQLVDFGAAMFFSLVAFYFYKYTGSFTYEIPNFILIPIIAIKSAFGGFFGLLRKDTWKTGYVEKDVTSSLIKGFFIAVPLFIVLLIILTQADPIFGKLVGDIVTTIGERLFVSFFVFTALVSFGSAIILEKIQQQKEISPISFGKAHELAVITGSVLFLFAAFIAVQFRYLFFTVAEKELSQLGIASLTYSEYVRKGFFELLIAAVIASGVIMYVLRYLSFFKDRQKRIVQVFSGLLTIETGLLLLSAAKRLFLYADAHGLTRARIFGFVFLIWLAVLLTIFFIRIVREIQKEQFFASIVIITIFVVMLINMVNIDGIIATQYKPTVNNEVDYYYIVSLSADASDAWAPAIEDADRILSQLDNIAQFSTEDNRKLYWAKSTLENVMLHATYLLEKYGDLSGKTLSEDEIQKRKWESYNMSEYSAYNTIHENNAAFSRITTLLRKATTLQDKASIEVRQNTPIDRSTKPPLMH